MAGAPGNHNAAGPHNYPAGRAGSHHGSPKPVAPKSVPRATAHTKATAKRAVSHPKLSTAAKAATKEAKQDVKEQKAKVREEKVEARAQTKSARATATAARASQRVSKAKAKGK
jgi:hypothetical protein